MVSIKGPCKMFVSPWEKEGVTKALDNRTLMGLFPPELRDRVEIRETTASQADTLADEGEIWKWLAFCLLAGLLLETVLAWRFGHR